MQFHSGMENMAIFFENIENIGYFRYFDIFDIYVRYFHFTALDWVMSIEKLVFNSSAASGVAVLRSEDPKVIIYVITFELIQPMPTVPQRYTDGRLYDSNTALCTTCIAQ